MFDGHIFGIVLVCVTGTLPNPNSNDEYMCRETVADYHSVAIQGEKDSSSMYVSSR